MSKIIDELYEKYTNEYLDDACMYFSQRAAFLRANGMSLIDEINKYLLAQSQDWKNYFESSKVDSEHVRTVRSIMSTFDSMTTPVSNLIFDYYDNNNDINEYTYDDIPSDLSFIKPHVLFNIPLESLREAQEKYGYLYEDDFELLYNFIDYVKKHNLLNKMTEYGSWQSMAFEELIYKLCDKITDKSVISGFKNDYFKIMETGLFDKIKHNSLKISKIQFENYRPQLNSNKQMNVDFGKYIFCLNLKNYLKTGLMPNKDGLFFSEVDMGQKDEIIESFKDVYSQDFNAEEFKNYQANLIFQPEQYSMIYDLWASKKIVKNNQLICGILFSSFPLESEFCNCYLIHINIEDATNNQSNYEIQLNLIPHGDFDCRVQLVRLDNWEYEHAHRNVAKKLKTNTHIHLYNELDMLRGKTNGAFDIAFNLEGVSTDFKTSLETFLNLLEFNANDISKIKNYIGSEISKIKNKAATTPIEKDAYPLETECVDVAE